MAGASWSFPWLNRADWDGDPFLDAASGVEALEVAVAIPLTDSAAWAEALSVAVALGLSDSGAGADSVAVAAAVLLTDAGAGSDAVAVAAAVAFADAGAATDALGVGVAFELPELDPPGDVNPTDEAAALDEFAVGVSLADAGGLIESATGVDEFTVERSGETPSGGDGHPIPLRGPWWWQKSPPAAVALAERATALDAFEVDRWSPPAVLPLLPPPRRPRPPTPPPFYPSSKPISDAEAEAVAFTLLLEE